MYVTVRRVFTATYDIFRNVVYVKHHTSTIIWSIQFSNLQESIYNFESGILNSEVHCNGIHGMENYVSFS